MTKKVVKFDVRQSTDICGDIDDLFVAGVNAVHLEMLDDEAAVLLIYGPNGEVAQFEIDADGGRLSILPVL